MNADTNSPAAATPPADRQTGVPRPSLSRRALGLLRRLGPAGPLALAAAVLPMVGGLVVYGRLAVLGPWLRSHPSAGPFLCAGVFALAGGLALVPTYAMSTLCGWSFGFTTGVAATLGGYLGAALLAYVLGGAAERGHVMRLVDGAPKWRAVHRALTRGRLHKVVLVVALVRLAPFAPFSLTNLVMASMRVPLPAYAAGTVLGMAPRTALIVFAASRLQALDGPPSEQPWLIAAGVLATVVVAAVLGLIGKRALAHATAAA